jgi:hypothetical protein
MTRQACASIDGRKSGALCMVCRHPERNVVDQMLARGCKPKEAGVFIGLEAGYVNRHVRNGHAAHVGVEVYREAKRAQSTGQWSASIRYTYGMSVEDFDAMVVSQSGLCAICFEQLLLPQIDHCHSTGRVRGLLCQPCNVGLGFLKDDPERLRNAVNYLDGANKLSC